MQTVRLVSDVEVSEGAMGYSALRRGFNGGFERMTVLFPRDGDGEENMVIVPAAAIAWIY